MKEPEKKLSFSSPMGYSFLLTILIILTIVIFAVLSLSTSLRDYEYSRRAAEKTTAYYEANTGAYRILQQIDETFTESGSLKEALLAVSELPEVTVEREDGKPPVISYTVKINEGQELQVALEADGESGKPACQIVEWKEASSKAWEGGTSLPVIGGERE